MKIENLKEGMVFKNYKELCEALGEKTKSSNSKNKQLKNWSRYFEYEKNKTFYTIKKIYNVPRIATDDQHLENFLLVNLVGSRKINDNGKCVLFGAKSTYYNMLSLVNNSYKDYRFSPKSINRDFNINYETAIELCELINSTLSYKLESLLDRLERGRYILKEEIYMVCIDNPDYISNEEEEEIFNIFKEELYLFDRDNIKVPMYIHRPAKECEKKAHAKIHTKTLEQMGLESFSKVFAKKRTKEYNDLLRQNLHTELGIKHMYKCYRVYFHDKYLKGKVKKIYKQYSLTEEQIKNEVNIINNSFREQLKLNSARRIERALTMLEEKKKNEEFIEWSYDKASTISNRTNENYLKDVDKFIKALIEINGIKALKDMSATILEDGETELELE
jgi:hypothetical protein